MVILNLFLLSCGHFVAARVLGENNENLGKIVAVLAKCLSKGSGGKDSLVDVATWHKIVMLLQQMNSSLPPPVGSPFIANA